MPNFPVDPTSRHLISARLSRRSVLLGAAGGGLAAALAGCSTGSASKPAGGGNSSAPAKLPPAADKSDTEKSVYWANWTLYLDFDDKTRNYPTLQAFQQQTGLAVAYDEDIDDNATYYDKIEAQLRGGQDIGQDVITLTDWMAARLIRNGWTQPFDAATLPNARNLLAALQNVDFDPGRNNSLPWQSGFGVLAWNKEKVPGGLHTVDDLWQPALKGRVEVVGEMRDTIGLIMLNQGVDVSGSFTADQFHNAVDVLAKQTSSGQLRPVQGNSYKEDLISGAALAVIGWSGDIFQLNAENGDKWGLTLPDAGGTLWSDDLMIPIGSPHKKNAEKLINYYYEPKVAATVEAAVNYICPVQGAQAEMEKIDADLAVSPWIFPTAEFLARAKVFRTLTPDEETTYNEAFHKVVAK